MLMVACRFITTSDSGVNFEVSRLASVWSGHPLLLPLMESSWREVRGALLLLEEEADEAAAAAAGAAAALLDEAEAALEEAAASLDMMESGEGCVVGAAGRINRP